MEWNEKGKRWYPSPIHVGIEQSRSTIPTYDQNGDVYVGIVVRITSVPP